MLAEIFGPDFLVVILIVVVVLFGGAAIPKLARNLGSARKEFEKGLKNESTDTTTTDGTAKPVDGPVNPS
jgi:sec-independent protein translocase protein TatA